ncbi:MAG: hypothetical protein WCI04_05270, partial [archaeon]
MHTKHFPLKGLHSDVLHVRFKKRGKIKAVIHRHDALLREVDMVLVPKKIPHIKKQLVTKTYALTFFPQKMDPHIALINQEIAAGGLIGKTFQKHGFEVCKNVLDVFSIEIPPWLKKRFNTRANRTKVRLAEFHARKNIGPPIVYGIVAEVYAPDFKRAGGINDVDLAQINPTIQVCEKLGIPWESWNFEREYASRVLEYFFREYQAGKTPNPDIM